MLTPSALRLLPTLAVAGVFAAACGDRSPTESSTSAPAGSKLLAVNGDGQVATACTQLDQPLTVRLVDASGKPLANIPVSWGAAAGSGELPSQQPQTDASGQATASWLLGLGSTETVVVTSGQATPATFTATATPNSSPPRGCS